MFYTVQVLESVSRVKLWSYMITAYAVSTSACMIVNLHILINILWRPEHRTAKSSQRHCSYIGLAVRHFSGTLRL